MKRRMIAICAGGAIALTGGGAWTAAAASGPQEKPSPDTIVQVEGDAENGFTIHHYGGSVEYPPTDSEALAECTEYDTSGQRIKCKAEVLTWYRDLGDMKKAIDWAHQSVRHR